MNRELSIYLHIPFCERKCLYCDFLSFNAEKELMDKYFRALAKEISVQSAVYSDYIVKSVFFGGGTPSFPDSDYICGALKNIFEHFEVEEGAEISIEANPASAIRDKLCSFRAAGFNRLSIGAQSLDDKELKALGRLHNSAEFFETFENARSAGFENINIDVMSALPGQSLESYLGTLRGAVSLKPEHISAYSLIVEEGTSFFDMDLDLPSEELDRNMYHETKRFLKEAGYHRYEISNYALGEDERFECFHNKVYWRRGNYLGLGLGASSMTGDVRWSNTRIMTDYLRVTEAADTLPEGLICDREVLDEKSRMEEFMFLGLRLIRGVSFSEFKKNFGRDLYEVYAEVIDKYKRSGHLEEAAEDGERFLRLTDRGLDVSNTVMADFLL